MSPGSLLPSPPAPSPCRPSVAPLSFPGTSLSPSLLPPSHPALPRGSIFVRPGTAPPLHVPSSSSVQPFLRDVSSCLSHPCAHPSLHLRSLPYIPCSWTRHRSTIPTQTQLPISNISIHLFLVGSSIAHPSQLTPSSPASLTPTVSPFLVDLSTSHPSQHVPISPSPLRLLHPPLPGGFIHHSAIPADIHLSVSSQTPPTIHLFLLDLSITQPSQRKPILPSSLKLRHLSFPCGFIHRSSNSHASIHLHFVDSSIIQPSHLTHLSISS